MFSINLATFAFLQTFILPWQPWKCHQYWCFSSSSFTSCQTKNI